MRSEQPVRPRAGIKVTEVCLGSTHSVMWGGGVHSQSGLRAAHV